ncbi:MAG: hypothetical protein J0L93_05985 [Deltaproteobacteria bacterium]|nr:hypothetical protein [Deltaproteobacteria bacterium]
MIFSVAIFIISSFNPAICIAPQVTWVSMVYSGVDAAQVAADKEDQEEFLKLKNNLKNPFDEIELASISALGDLGERASIELKNSIIQTLKEVVNGNATLEMRGRAIRSLESIGEKASPEQRADIIMFFFDLIKNASEFQIKKTAIDGLGFVRVNANHEEANSIVRNLLDTFKNEESAETKNSILWTLREVSIHVSPNLRDEVIQILFGIIKNNLPAQFTSTAATCLGVLGAKSKPELKDEVFEVLENIIQGKSSSFVRQDSALRSLRDLEVNANLQLRNKIVQVLLNASASHSAVGIYQDLAIQLIIEILERQPTLFDILRDPEVQRKLVKMLETKGNLKMFSIVKVIEDDRRIHEDFILNPPTSESKAKVYESLATYAFSLDKNEQIFLVENFLSKNKFPHLQAYERWGESSYDLLSQYVEKSENKEFLFANKQVASDIFTFANNRNELESLENAVGERGFWQILGQLDSFSAENFDFIFEKTKFIFEDSTNAKNKKISANALNALLKISLNNLEQEKVKELKEFVVALYKNEKQSTGLEEKLAQFFSSLMNYNSEWKEELSPLWQEAVDTVKAKHP